MEKRTVQLAIEGMTCDHCAVTIERALHDVPGVEHAAKSRSCMRASARG
ncbi:MAG: cation transporter [Acidobacteria bacterium]|nr:cation transporter [Acidobacteriota bacterium]